MFTSKFLEQCSTIDISIRWRFDSLKYLFCSDRYYGKYRLSFWKYTFLKVVWFLEIFLELMLCDFYIVLFSLIFQLVCCSFFFKIFGNYKVHELSLSSIKTTKISTSETHLTYIGVYLYYFLDLFFPFLSNKNDDQSLAWRKSTQSLSGELSSQDLNVNVVQIVKTNTPIEAWLAVPISYIEIHRYDTCMIGMHTYVV